MRTLRRQSFWRSLRRRLGAGLTLLAYVLTAFGVPLPAGNAATTACGCVSDEVCQSGSCCCSSHRKARAASCCTGQPGCTKPCCRHGKPSDSCPHEGQSPSDPDDDAPTGGVRWVIGIAAMKCRGHSTVWVSGGVVLPAPLPLVALPKAEPVGRLVHADETAVAIDYVPSVPPPRPVQA